MKTNLQLSKYSSTAPKTEDHMPRKEREVANQRDYAREREREERRGEKDGTEGKEGRKGGRGREGKEGRRQRVRQHEREREREREKEQERFSQPLLGSVHCPLSSPHPLSSPAMALGGGPAQLWSAEDMDRVAAGDCTYVPTQLYPTQRTDSPQSLYHCLPCVVCA